MTTEELLLTVLTVAIVTLIIAVLAVLIVLFQTLRKFKTVSTELQQLTEKGTMAAERLAPFSAAAVAILQIGKALTKKRK